MSEVNHPNLTNGEYKQSGWVFADGCLLLIMAGLKFKITAERIPSCKFDEDDALCEIEGGLSNARGEGDFMRDWNSKNLTPEEYTNSKWERTPEGFLVLTMGFDRFEIIAKRIA